MENALLLSFAALLPCEFEQDGLDPPFFTSVLYG